MLLPLLLSAALLSTPGAAAKAPEQAAPAHKPFTWVVPKVIEELSIPGETWSLGIPVRLHALRSREHPENILRDFVLAARKQGLFFPPPSSMPRAAVETTATAYDPIAQRSYTVVLQPEPDGTTGVILSEADLARRQKVRGDFFVPLPPGALNPLSTRLEGFETLSFDLPASRGDPLAFFRAELPRGGYTEVEPQVFRRRDDELSVKVVPPGPGQKHPGVVILRRTAAPPTAGELFAPRD